MFCENCGANVPDDFKFCENCGARTGELTNAPPHAQQPYTGQPFAQHPQQYTVQYAATPQPTPPNQPNTPQAAYPAQQQTPAYTSQQYAAQQSPQQHYAHAPQQYAAPQSAAPQKKKGGWIMPYRIIAAVFAVALIAAGVYGLFRNPGGGKGGGGNGNGDIAKGSSASVKDELIQLNNATLDFGANNVTEGASMTVLKPTESQKPDGLVSDLFELELIHECTEPVTVSLPVDESQVPEDCFVMLGVGNTMDSSDGYGDTIYSYYPVEINDWVATATFIPADSLQNMEVLFAGATPSVPSRERVTLGLFWFNKNSAQLRSGGHFIVYFRGFRFVEADRLALLDDLESIYNDYLNKGYVYSQRKDWPMEVYIEELNAEGYYVYRVNGYIQLNRSFFENGYNRAGVVPLVAHEFFHFTQYNYYKSFLSDNLWCDEATATYFELKNGGNPELPSAYFPLNFSGVFPENNTKYEGYARGPLISYLAGRFGEGFILNAYQEASESVFPDLKSCIRNATETEQVWAADYYEALVTNKIDIYSILPATLRLNIAGGGDYANVGKTLDLIMPGEKEIAAADEDGEPIVIGETTVNLGNYNAQFVVLEMSDVELFLLEAGDLDEPTVILEGPNAESVSLRVISYKGSSVNVRRGVDGKVTLSDFKEKMTSGTRYIIMAVGPAGTKETYDIRVEFEAEYPMLDELVGTYADGVMTITSVVLDPVFRAALESQEASGDDDLGCDLNLIAMLEEMVGEENPNPMTIEKTGENTGRLIMGDPSDADPDSIFSFTYTNGVIRAEKSTQQEGGANVYALEIKAAYGQNRETAELEGSITMLYRLALPEYSGDAIVIKSSVQGTKPLK